MEKFDITKIEKAHSDMNTTYKAYQILKKEIPTTRQEVNELIAHFLMCDEIVICDKLRRFLNEEIL